MCSYIPNTSFFQGYSQIVQVGMGVERLWMFYIMALYALDVGSYFPTTTKHNSVVCSAPLAVMRM
ncbi:MAG: hypothetical protein GX087_03775 [Desulfobulbaceae bacterium]|nr:hypothetical protein [Desulfobulbaceae bacterium]